MKSSDLKRQELFTYVANETNKVLGMVERTIRNKDTEIMVSFCKALVFKTASRVLHKCLEPTLF